MPNAAWKDAERQVAKRLGGRRNPFSVQGGVDVLHPLWAVEVKLTARPPAYLLHGLQEAERHAVGFGQVPLLVVHPKGSPHDLDVVCVRLKDWQDLHGSI